MAGRAQVPTGLNPGELGRRVTLRYLGGDGRATDVVGTLVALTDDSVTVRTRDGADVVVVAMRVIAARAVPADGQRLRRAADVDPATLERIAAQGWRPTESEPLGAWTLRAARGFTGRANSVLPLGEPGLGLDAALAQVEAWYRRRELPPRFQVPLPWGSVLDAELADRRWTAAPRVCVQVADVLTARQRLAGCPTVEARVAVDVADRPSTPWLSVYRQGRQPVPAVATDLLRHADDPAFVLVTDPDGPVAVGRGALTPGWLGITAVDVVPRARRRGLGRLVVAVLLARAEERGARFAYLQVAEENIPARALYAQSGFADHHHYHYREAPNQAGDAGR